MKILVIVPAYNEQENLPGVIRDLKEYVPHAEVLVVNDGSHDATGTIAEGMGVKVLTLPFNLGIGGAMQTGYRYAQKHGFDIAVQFDGDGQHIAGEIEKLIRPILEGTADIVIGSRFMSKGFYNAPIMRRIGMLVFSTVLSRILGMRMTDTTSGFRAANRRVIEFFSRTYPDDYPEVESLVLLHRRGLRIIETPVLMRSRTGGKSSITPIRSVYYMVKVILAVCIGILKKVR